MAKESISPVQRHLEKHSLSIDLIDAYANAAQAITEVSVEDEDDDELSASPDVTREILEIMAEILPRIDAEKYKIHDHFVDLLRYSPRIRKLADANDDEKEEAIEFIMQSVAEGVADAIAKNILKKKKREEEVNPRSLTTWNRWYRQTKADFGILRRKK